VLLSIHTNRYANDDGFLQLNANGSLDTTFGTNGFMTEGHLKGVVRLQTSVPDPKGYKIVLGASDGVTGPGGAQQFTVQRFGSDGTIDTTFGTNGTATAVFGIDPRHTAGTAQVGSTIRDI